MASGRRLPQDARFPAIAKDWSTGQTEATVEWHQGRWWEAATWEFHSTGRWRRFDQRKRDRNLAFRRFLSGQATDPGL